jgi:glycosyltransferase involved in cell wall biosynthesis
MTGKPKRIGIVANCAWNIVNFRLDLIRALGKRKYELVVLAPEDSFAAHFAEMNIPFHPIKNLNRNGTNPFRDLLLFFELSRLFRQYELDLVLLYTIKPNVYGTFAAKWAGIPSIATLTGLGYLFLRRRHTGFMARKLYKWALQFSGKIVFHNPDDLSLFLEHRLVKRQNSTVIPGSGVNMDHFSPQPSTGKKERIRFLFMGRILYDKGVRELLQAFEKLYREEDSVELWLVGDMDTKNPSIFSREELNRYEKSVKTIVYKGHTDDVRPYIAGSDVVVLPSYREGLPKTILEAMSMEKPIIVSDVPGCRETIVEKEPVNGYFCRSKDPESLYRQLLKMVRLSDQERDQMGRISREFVREKFESSKIVAAYEKLIGEILGNHKSP